MLNKYNNKSPINTINEALKLLGEMKTQKYITSKPYFLKYFSKPSIQTNYQN